MANSARVAKIRDTVLQSGASETFPTGNLAVGQAMSIPGKSQLASTAAYYRPLRINSQVSRKVTDPAGVPKIRTRDDLRLLSKNQGFTATQ